MGIDTYLTVVFWLGILSLVIRSALMYGEYPRIEQKSLGQDAFEIMLQGLFFAWVCVLKFN